MPRHSKKLSVGVKLRAGGDPNRSEKLGWSAGDTGKWPQKMPRYPVSPKRVLFLFKVSKMCVCFFMVKITINFKISIEREWLILLVS